MEIDRYVLETLMPDLVGHDRHPSAFLVYLFLWTATQGGERPAQVSLAGIARGTGLSKRAVQGALERLTRRELVQTDRDGITAVSRYTLHRPWLRYRSGPGSPSEKSRPE
jgi:DNA-binding transcriptional ArsR family regulator